MTTIVVLGATSGIAHATARRWADSPGCQFRLVARDGVRLAEVSADLAARTGQEPATALHDLSGAEGIDDALDFGFADGPVDILLVAFGVMPSQEEADADPAKALALLTVNGVMTAYAAHDATLRLERQGSGTAVVIGSVAGDRGRKSNYLYGSAKAMVATAVEGLQHRVAGSDVHLVLVKPGPTATPMTDHLPGARSFATVQEVAEDIVDAVERRQSVVYTPGRWRLIMAVVKRLPRRLFHRTNL